MLLLLWSYKPIEVEMYAYFHPYSQSGINESKEMWGDSEVTQTW
jgi:hypothetical protein